MRRASAAADHLPVGASSPPDPLRLCVYTTIGLLAWLLGPPVVVAWMSGMGLVAYRRAWRMGLRRSKCFLGDVRLVTTPARLLTTTQYDPDWLP